KTQPHTLTVTKGSEPEESSSASYTGSGVDSVDKEDVGLAAKDIRFIKTVDDGKVPAATPLYKNPVYWLIDLSLFLVFALMSFLSAKKAGAKSDLQSFRFRRSHQLARGKLRDASRMLKQGKADDFYAEVSKAVYGYFADKLNIPPQAVT